MSKEKQCLSTIVDFFDVIFGCHCSTNNSYKSHKSNKSNKYNKSHSSRRSSYINMLDLTESLHYDYLGSLSSIAHGSGVNYANSTHQTHVLKPQTVTFVGGKTLYGRRVSNL